MIYAEQVSVKQRDTEEDLAKAEPAVVAAMAALDTLNKKASPSCGLSYDYNFKTRSTMIFLQLSTESPPKLESSGDDVVFLR